MMTTLKLFSLAGILLLGVFSSFLPQLVTAQLKEHERKEEYFRRNYTWPPRENDFIPNTPGWRSLMEHRFRQVEEIKNRHDRYEGFIQTVNAALISPNFTEYGFGLARAPEDLMVALRKGIREGVEKGPRLEREIEVIEGDQPWFIDRPDLTKRVLKELQHFPETWVGMELEAHRAYGFRLYRNNSRLHMHIDRSQTHIVSFILHIDSSDDAEPWPLVIEDFQGRTHEVILKSGDLLFYESSKCFHGRPHTFKGSWYSSVFVHYYPKYGWADVDHDLEKHFRVPPSWTNEPQSAFEIPLQMVGTSMTEPSCPNNWCQTQYSKKWSGPGEEGYWIDPNGEKHPFVPKKVVCEDSDPRCPDWASWESDECRNNAGFMLVNCKKSCGACTGAAKIGSSEL